MQEEKNYYEEIKNRIIDDEVYSTVKNYSKERHRVITYFEIGRLLTEAGGKYGDKIIDKYSKRLVVEVGRKFNRRTLFRMKQLYNLFNDEKVSPVVTQLTWSHYILLLPIKNYDEICYYIDQIFKRNLSKRQLETIIKSKEYERLPKVVKEKLVENEKFTVIDFVKNPIYIRTNNNEETVSEKLLQKLILENIPAFLEELGTGFTFIKNEYPIKLGNIYNYIDLLLYNIKYRCYVVVELKVTKLKKEHTGQIMTYMNFIDRNVKSTDDNKTVGIIICKKDNKYVIEYCSDKRIIAREYKILPIK